MDLRHLRYFAALADTRSFRRTAQRLNVSQPTLSRGIRQLESMLGMPLFDRAARGVDLTAAGAAFRPYCERVLAEIESGVLAVKQLQRLERGSLHMGVLHSFSKSLLGPTLARFALDYPNVSVIARLLPQLEMERQLVNGTLDLLVAYASQDTAHIVSESLFDDDMVVVVGLKHPLAKAQSVDMRDLGKLKLVVLTREFAAREYLDRFFPDGSRALSVALEMDSVDPILATVRQSTLATVLSAGAVAGATGLRCIPLSNPKPRRTVAILWRRAGCRSAAAERMGGMIRAAYGDPAPRSQTHPPNPMAHVKRCPVAGQSTKRLHA